MKTALSKFSTPALEVELLRRSIEFNERVIRISQQGLRVLIEKQSRRRHELNRKEIGQ
jgi:hypothetical protein